MNILKSISLSNRFLMCCLTLFIILPISNTKARDSRKQTFYTQHNVILSLMHHSSFFPQYDDILVLVKCVTNTCHSSDRVHSACHLNIEILTPRNITSNVSPETLRFPIKFNILSSPQNSFHC